MPTRLIDSAIWSETSYQKLPAPAKLLYIWSFSNPHVDAPGIYRVGIATISFETGIPEENLPEYFKLLKGQVEWYPEKEIVWVKNFLQIQNFSPTYLQRARTKLDQIQKYCNNGLCDEVLEYNIKLGILIPMIGNKTEKSENIGKYTLPEALSIADGKKKVSAPDKAAVIEQLRKKGYKVGEENDS